MIKPLFNNQRLPETLDESGLTAMLCKLSPLLVRVPLPLNVAKSFSCNY